MIPEIREKYRRYEFAVQNPRALIAFIERIAGRPGPLALREDFCGTARLAAQWVKSGPRREALGIDLAAEPLAYGEQTHRARLRPGAQKRLRLHEGDVRRAPAGKFDVIVALNFSYCIFRERAQLLDYFRRVRRALRAGGFLLIDLFGGDRAHEVRTRKIDYGTFEYRWECVAFNPVQNRGTYAIHFKPRGGKLVANAFVYDWRLWTCPELREILADAGFASTTAYWEGDHPRNGGGDGKFEATEWEESCDVWQSFIVARV